MRTLNTLMDGRLSPSRLRLILRFIRFWNSKPRLFLRPTAYDFDFSYVSWQYKQFNNLERFSSFISLYILPLLTGYENKEIDFLAQKRIPSLVLLQRRV